jgi:hypothetical protein
MVQLFLCRSNGQALFTYLLRLDVTFTMTPSAAPDSRWNRTWVFEAQTPKTVLLVVLRPKPPNCSRVIITTHVTVVLDCSIAKSPSTSALLARHHLDPVNMVHSSMYTCAHWSFSGPSVHARRTFFTASLSAWTRMTFTFTIDHCLRAPHLHSTSQETCCTTQLTHQLVQQLNPRRYSQWQSLITTRTT